MKELLLIRHAKAGWNCPELDDHDRPLKKRGVRDAQIMGNILCEEELLPEKVFISSSLRTRETARILFDQTIPAEIIPELYLADTYMVEDIVVTLDDTLTRAALVGHNPTFTDLVQISGCELDNLPTCGVVHFRWETDSWRECSFQTAEVVSLFRPKEFR